MRQEVFTPCSGHTELLRETTDTFKEKELDTIPQDSSLLLSTAQATAHYGELWLWPSICVMMLEKAVPRFFHSLDLCREMFAVGRMKVFVTLKGSDLSWTTVCMASDWSELPSTQASKRESWKRSSRIKFPCVSPFTTDGLHTDKLYAFGDLQMGK